MKDQVMLMWLLRIITIIMLVGFGWLLRNDIRFKRHPYHILLKLLAMFYPLGKFWQAWLLPGVLIRGYASDIGWCFFWAVVGYYYGVSKKMKYPMVSARLHVWFYFLVAIVWELSMIFWLNKYTYSKAYRFNPRGDWGDIGIFMVTFVIALWLVNRLNNLYVQYYKQQSTKEESITLKKKTDNPQKRQKK